MMKMFNNIKANLAAVLPTTSVNFFGAMAEKVDNTADEVAILREEIAALRARPVAETAEAEVAEEGYTDYSDAELRLLEQAKSEGGKVVSELTWKCSAVDLVVTLMAKGMHPVLFDELAAAGDNVRKYCEDAKNPGCTLTNGTFVPGYNQFKGQNNASNVSNAWAKLWQRWRTRRSDRYMEMSMFKQLCSCAVKFDMSWGEFVPNEMLVVAESTEPVIDWGSMGNEDFSDYEEAAASLSDADVPPEVPAAEEYDPFMDMGGYTNTCDEAEEADATSMPEPEEADATEMPSEEADATEMPEAEAEADATAMPEVDAEEVTGDEPEQAHVPHVDEDGKLTNPETFEYPEVPAVHTDWNKRLVIRNGIKKYKFCSNWAKAFVPVQAPEGELDAWSVQHAIYLQELIHWGFSTEAWVMADRDNVGYSKDGRLLITNGRFWADKLAEFRAEHPESAVNRKERLATFEFRAWLALFRNTANKTQRDELRNTCDAHLVAGKGANSSSTQTTLLTRTMEYCRELLECESYNHGDEGEYNLPF